MRTGIRCGVAPSDVWHLRAPGAGLLCGRKRYRASIAIERGDVAAAVRQVESQGGSVCRGCLRKATPTS